MKDLMCANMALALQSAHTSLSKTGGGRWQFHQDEMDMSVSVGTEVLKRREFAHIRHTLIHSIVS